MVARVAAVLGGRRRALALAGLTAALAAYTAGSGELWNAGLWPDVLFVSLVVIPATLGARSGFSCRSRSARDCWPSRSFSARLAVVMSLADLDVLFNLTKLFALALLGFWFLTYFENVAWAALVAAIIPWVDIWSVFFGPTGKITGDHPSIFERISIAFRLPGEAVPPTSGHRTSSSSRSSSPPHGGSVSARAGPGWR